MARGGGRVFKVLGCFRIKNQIQRQISSKTMKSEEEQDPSSKGETSVGQISTEEKLDVFSARSGLKCNSLLLALYNQGSFLKKWVLNKKGLHQLLSTVSL